jgi:hypothetical protein
VPHDYVGIVAVKQDQREDVYDIEVDDPIHAVTINGVAVAQSIDAIRYGLYWTYPTLFLTAHPSNQVVELDPEALGIAEALSRMRIDAGYTPERYASFEQQWSLGEL